jgi:hypothetical protein
MIHHQSLSSISIPEKSLFDEKLSSHSNSLVILLIDDRLDVQFLTSKTFDIFLEKIIIEPSPKIFIFSPFAIVTYYFVVDLLKFSSKFLFPVM